MPSSRDSAADPPGTGTSSVAVAAAAGAGMPTIESEDQSGDAVAQGGHYRQPAGPAGVIWRPPWG